MIGPSRPLARESKLLDAKFRGLLEAAPDAMVNMNRAGHVIPIKAQRERLFGHSREELLGAPVEVLIPDRFRKEHPAFRKAYFRRAKPSPMARGLDLFRRRKDGTESPAEISLSPVETEEGVFATAAIRDTSDRRKVEAKFRGLLRVVRYSFPCEWWLTPIDRLGPHGYPGSGGTAAGGRAGARAGDA